MQSTTVVAHSMGAIVTRSLITRPGNTFWDAAFTRPIDALILNEADRASLKEAFFWEPERHVKRVIYIAASHRGSDLAEKAPAKIARWLVKPPGKFGAFYGRISAANPGAFTPAYRRLGSGKLDSIHSLSPEQPSLKILADLPNSHRVATHSIIAVKGMHSRLEDSDDGTVPYWSSHLPDADSEKIIHSGHFAMNHPDTVAEIKRILLLKHSR